MMIKFADALRALKRAHKTISVQDPRFSELISPLIDTAYAENGDPRTGPVTTPNENVTVARALNVLRAAEKPVPAEDPLYKNIIRRLLGLAYSGAGGQIILCRCVDSVTSAQQAAALNSLKPEVNRNALHGTVVCPNAVEYEARLKLLKNLDLGLQIVSTDQGYVSLVIWGS